MPDVTVSTDVDSLLKSADNAAARTNLGLGTAAEADTGDFATSEQGGKADNALQPSDNITELTNNAGFITSVGNLQDVTNNGATTTNDISVGNRITTGNNTAAGATATAIGGQNNTASGQSAEVLGGDGSTASGQGSSVIGGSNHQNAANWAATIGGLNQTVASGAARSAILGGFGHNLNHSDSVILGGNSITTDATATVFVQNLNVKDGFKMPTGAGDTYVMTSDANGKGTWQAAAGGGGGGTVQGTDQTYDIQPADENTSVVAGGTRGEYSVDLSTNRGLSTHIASGMNSTLSGGASNTASALSSTVSGGDYNSATAQHATVSGGQMNTVNGLAANVGGGFGNTASGGNGTIGGGKTNNISSAANYGTIGGGLMNTVSDAYSYVTVSGGYKNEAKGWGCTIAGGQNNTAGGSYSYYNAIGGGKNNTCTGGTFNGGSFIGGGSNNQITGAGLYSAILGGHNNSITQSAIQSMIVGNSCQTNEQRNTLIGTYIKCTGVSDTIEIGNWTSITNRASSIRIHKNKQVAHSVVDSATAPTDGGATAGSEVDGSLARGMFTIQKNGNAVTLYFNNGGTIQSLSLGTLS